MEGGSGLTLNAGLRYDLQFLETIHTDTNNLSPRVGFAWSPSDVTRTIVRGSAGLFYDRVPLRALANAFLSAGNTTDLTNLQQISVSLSPAQTDAPVFPNILSAAVPLGHAGQLHDDGSRHCRTRIPVRRASRSSGKLAAAARVSVGYQYVRGSNLIISGESERSDVRGGGIPTTAAVRTRATRTTISIRRRAFELSRLAPVVRPAARRHWGYYRVTYTLSKSMNNVGEIFFSSPIDPLRSLEGLGPIRRRSAPSAGGERGASTRRWSRRTAVGEADPRLSGERMLQAYSALPFNITSGVTHDPGHRRPSDRER